MSIAFRCEHCGKLLRAQGPGTTPVRCDRCGKLAEVPAGLASLPHVRVPAAAHALGQQAACTVSAKREMGMAMGGAEAPSDDSSQAAGTRGLAALEAVMPLVLSLFFHLGLVLVTVFLGTLVISTKAADAGAISVPDVGVADGRETNDFVPRLPVTSSRDGETTFETPFQKITPSSSRMLLHEPPGGDGKAALGKPLIGVGPPTGDDGNGRGLHLGEGPDGDRSRIFGPRRTRRDRVGSAPQNVVYVVDRSGSMMNSFDRVRDEMFRSIGNLEPNRQSFHVILFSDGAPLEPADKRLVPPTGEYIRAVTQFLSNTPAKGQTDPLPALARAFDALDKVRGTKVIYLLTDSQFPDGEKVLQLLRQRNAKKEVRIFPILYGEGSSEAEQTMRKIADENGHTTFRHVQPEE